MPIFYRGAAPGTYWNSNDARTSGFPPRNSGITASPDRIIQHIYNGLTDSPYVSLTRSYSVALHYALEAGTSQPTKLAPGFVYELEITDASGVQLIDPVKEIAAGAPPPLSAVPYQHDGHQTVVLGVASALLAGFLRRPIIQPGTVSPMARSATISAHLRGLVAALRDAEILAIGTIPRNCVVNRYDVY